MSSDRACEHESDKRCHLSSRTHRWRDALWTAVKAFRAGGGSVGLLYHHSALQYQHWMTHHFSLTNSFLERKRGGGSDKKIVRHSAGGEDRQTERERQREMGISQCCWLPQISTDKASLWCSVKCKIKMRQKPRGAWHPLLQLKTGGFSSFLVGSSPRVPVRLFLKSGRC